MAGRQEFQFKRLDVISQISQFKDEWREWFAILQLCNIKYMDQLIDDLFILRYKLLT